MSADILLLQEQNLTPGEFLFLDLLEDATKRKNEGNKGETRKKRVKKLMQKRFK